VRVDLFRGVEVAHTWHVAAPAAGTVRVLCGGTQARGTAQDQAAAWNCSLRTIGASLHQGLMVGAQAPGDCITGRDADRIDWQSVTAGNDAGISCVLQPTGAAGHVTCVFESAQVATEFRPADLALDRIQLRAGGLSLRVAIDAAPDPAAPLDVELTWTDPDWPAVPRYGGATP
jgi:hypothetical protein